MKIAISGKGGVGKTLLASLLCKIFAESGYSVLAIDADPDSNLAATLGFPQAEEITPISEMKELVEERTGARPGKTGIYFKLNPQVDDIPDRFSISKDGIRLLVLGTVKKGGSGCICPESALLKSLLTHLLLRRDEIVILDMEAGIEHLGRGTASAVDAFITVVEPGMRSLETAKAVRKLAEDIGIKKCYVVGNKIEHDTDRQFITDNLPDFTVLGFISQNPKIGEADRKGISPYDLDPKVVSEVKAVREQLAALSGGGLL